MEKQPSIEDVKNFWENNPLFSGESQYEVGSKLFFEEHRQIVLEDCFAGRIPDELFIPENLAKDARILDLGCGCGFWTVELQKKGGGYKNFYAADLTQKALELTRKRLELYGLNANLSIQNAEKMNYQDGFFEHLNCQGVIHHTPNMSAAIKEIARVLKKDDTAYISVYYKNLLIKNWHYFAWAGKILYKVRVRLKGRGREGILLATTPEEMVRMFDGKENPVGKAYSIDEVFRLIDPYFTIEKTYLGYFPKRILPFKLSAPLHKFLLKNLGFLLYLNLRKK